MMKLIKKLKAKFSKTRIEQKIRLFKRSFRFFMQRRKRGWDDSDTWSLDHSLAKVILPRLKRFKEVAPMVPADYNSEAEWQADLDKMIAAFEFAASEERWGCYDKEKWEEVHEGIELFAKNYFALWW